MSTPRPQHTSQSIAAYYAQLLKESVRLGSRSRRAILNSDRVVPPTRAEIVEEFLLLKNFRTLEGIAALWDRALYHDACILVRATFEAYLQFLHLWSDPEKHGRQFFEFGFVVEHRFHADVDEASGPGGGKNWEANKRLAAEQLTKNSRTYDIRLGWYQMSLRKLAKLLDAKHDGIWLDYEFLYGTTSAFVHAKPNAIWDYIQTKSISSGLRVRTGCPTYMRAMPLLACSWCLAMAFLMIGQSYRKTKNYRVAMLGDKVLRMSQVVSGLIEADEKGQVPDWVRLP